MRWYLYFLLVLLLTCSASAQNLTDGSNYNPDGKIGGLVLTCFGGFRVGDAKFSERLPWGGNHKDKWDNAGGYHFGVSFDYIATKSHTFLFTVSYDRITFEPNKTEYGDYKYWETLLNVTAGVRFFIFSD